MKVGRVRLRLPRFKVYIHASEERFGGLKKL